MRSLVAVLLASVLLLSGCARGGGVHLLDADDLPADLYGGEDPGESDVRDVTVTVYFVRVAANTEESQLEAIRRSGTTDRTDAEFAVAQLLRGPDEGEVDDGLRPAIPPGTRLLGVSVANDVASVNLTGEFEGPAEDFVHVLRIAQVVWTLTSLPGVDRVRFLVHGVPQPVIDQDGTARDVVSRARYSRVAARIEGADIDPCSVADTDGC